MSATRNPYYQLPGGADLPGDVRVSDTEDATKTAAGGWAASPAALASVAASLSSLICNFCIGNNSAHFKFTPVINGLRSSFVLISITQNSYICCDSLIVYNSNGTNVYTEFVSKGLSVDKIVTSMSGNIIDVTISYTYENVWGELFVIPSGGVKFVDQ